jgi:hypothetical protein
MRQRQGLIQVIAMKPISHLSHYKHHMLANPIVFLMAESIFDRRYVRTPPKSRAAGADLVPSKRILIFGTSTLQFLRPFQLRSPVHSGLSDSTEV